MQRPAKAPFLFCLGAMIAVVGYQVGQRVTRPDNSVSPLSKYLPLIRCLPAVFAILIAEFLIGQNWVYRQQLARLARLQQVADVLCTDGMQIVLWFQLRDIPVRLRPLVSRDKVSTSVHFRPGINNPGRHIQECGFKRLHIVSFTDSKIDVEDDIALADNTPLTILNFNYCRISEGVLDTLHDFPKLSKLVIRGCSISSKEREEVTPLPISQLHESPDAQNCDQLLKGVAGHPTLRTLVLDDTPITDKGLESVLGLSNLSFIKLSRTRVQWPKLQGLNRPQLSLWLDGTQIDDTAMRMISQLPTLGYLNIAKTRVTSAGVVQLVKVPRLSTLVMDDCDVGEEVRVHLSAMARLQSWSARNTRMTSPNFHDP
ncbi:MAG: hypothetical protein U0929_20850 [Planctomycetaceae bacterium]